VLARVVGALSERARVNTHTLLGDPAGRLLARAAAADLLVVGSRGLGAVRRLLLGTVAEKVHQQGRNEEINPSPRAPACTNTRRIIPTMRGRVLIVDDEPEMVESTARLLTLAGHRCTTTTVAQEALAALESQPPDVLLTDLKMPGMEGLELLRRAHRVDPDLPVIVITAFASIESAVGAVKEGAFDYLPKPFSAEQLRVAVDRAFRQRELRRENRNLRRQLQQTLGLENIIGRSPAMVRVFELIKKAARSEANILVLGESGTGKELVARAIHANSERAPRPFVPVDCASLPENLLESELFGHEKGAFTGAVKAKSGLIEMANHGTVFLDEIGELPLALQSKFLRALQERTIRRVGGTDLIELDLRVVSATNRDLRQQIAQGRFREELFYRINVIAIELPALRERAGDVTLLAHAFLDKYGRGGGLTLDEAALAALEAYAWPGNVRELQNVIERACALADGPTVRPRDLPDYVLSRSGARAPAGAATDGGTPAMRTDLPLKRAKEQWMESLEGAYLRELLERHQGNISAAAKVAGIDRKTFHRLINKYRLR
jgi:DNA-binding NtrC family response regulator